MIKKTGIISFILLAILAVSYVYDKLHSVEFVEIPIDITGYNIADIGVVDVNNDNWLDLFTVNHDSQQGVFINNGNEKFINQVSIFKLDQDAKIPGLEDSEQPPAMKKVGLYIYRMNRKQLILHSKGIGEFSGELELTSIVDMSDSIGINPQVIESKTPTGAMRSKIKFTLKGDETLVLKTHFYAIPHKFIFDNRIESKNIYIGTQLINPETNDFVLLWRDRHAMAWSDYDNNGQIDVFITRGGLKGRMSEFPEIFTDELLMNNSGVFSNRINSSGIVKSGCPGRQISWVDADNDGLLDLYIVCGTQHKERIQGAVLKNQLYKQIGKGLFRNIASEVGLDMVEDGTFLWLDADLDNDQDMIWAARSGIWLFRNDQAHFTRLFITEQPNINMELPEAGMRYTNKLSAIDYDNDGDFDVFVSSTAGNILLINENGRYSVIEPSSIGLPKMSAYANWVDYDNDGLADLHTLPDGLYHQKNNSHFEKMELLGTKAKPPKLIDVRCSWVDFNNDGWRDVIITTEERPTWKWKTKLYMAHGNNNFWLQIKLEGFDGNREAIGARVQVVTKNNTQIQQVGFSEGSYYSQGHYRMYFGLGKEKKIQEIQVEWPNGQVDKYKNITTNRLIKISVQSKNIVYIVEPAEKKI